MTKEKKGDIAAWLRRRQSWDQVLIPGFLARHIADHIEHLEKQLNKRDGFL